MKALGLFELHSKQADTLLNEISSFRKLSRNWGGLLEKERVRLEEAKKELKSLEQTMESGAFDLRSHVWCLLDGSPTSASGKSLEKAKKIADKYRQMAEDE